jgi:hypothetical protein
MSESIPKVVRSPRSSPRQAIATPLQPTGALTPLSYLLQVVNDPSASDARRDKCAIAAAPYVHPRPLAEGKKQRQVKAAEEAGAGTEWEGDLDWLQH